MAKHAYKPRRPGSLKEATERLVSACGGPTACGRDEGCRVSKPTLYAYTDQDNDDNRVKHVPVDIVRYLERRCGEPIVTRYLAAETGHVLLKLDVPETVGALPPALMTAAKEASDVYAVAAQALTDSTLTAVEAAKLKREIHEAMTAFAAIASLLESYLTEEDA